MNADKFWFGWMKVTILLVILIGAFISIGAPFVSSDFLDQKINLIFLSECVASTQVELMKKWLMGVTGAIMIGWGVTMMYILNNAFKKREKWAWQCIFYPILFWYIIDSSVSGYFGANFNVVGNTILFLQFMAPLLYLRNQFFPLIKTIS